jgi:hypothetical protein
MGSDGWRNVVEQEQRSREQRATQGKGTQEVYRLEQDAAREGHFQGEAPEAQPGLLAKIKQAIIGLFGRS